MSRFNTGVIVAALVSIGIYYSSQDEHTPSTVFAPADGAGNWFQSKRGYWMYTKTWVPEKAPTAIVVLVHGFGEHLDRAGYTYLAKKLTGQGFVVVGMEHQGHGKSNGDRAYFNRFVHLSEDQIDFIESKKKTYPGLNVFAWGHSMGGAITILSARSRPDLFTAVVLSAPLVKLHDEKLTTFNKVMAPIMANLAPKLLFPEELDVNMVSRNKEAVKEYIRDPLISKGHVRCRVGSEIMDIAEFIQSHAHELTTPFYLLHGDADGICDIKGSEILFSKAGTAEKTFIKMKGMFHELYEDDDRDKYVPGAIDFFKKYNVKSKL